MHFYLLMLHLRVFKLVLELGLGGRVDVSRAFRMAAAKCLQADRALRTSLSQLHLLGQTWTSAMGVGAAFLVESANAASRTTCVRCALAFLVCGRYNSSMPVAGTRKPSRKRGIRESKRQFFPLCVPLYPDETPRENDCTACPCTLQLKLEALEGLNSVEALLSALEELLAQGRAWMRMCAQIISHCACQPQTASLTATKASIRAGEATACIRLPAEVTLSIDGAFFLSVCR